MDEGKIGVSAVSGLISYGFALGFLIFELGGVAATVGLTLLTVTALVVVFMWFNYEEISQFNDTSGPQGGI